MELILDTNFIISAFKNKIPLFDILREKFPEYKIIVPYGVIGELEKIVINKNLTYTKKEKEISELALFLIKKNNLKVEVFGEGDVDTWILKYCVKNKCVVATLDRQLRSKIKLKSPETKFLILRNISKIEIL
ncbi:MAG: PIN domain-containing protein [Candidatus Pacearchaeota archaeon]